MIRYEQHPVAWSEETARALMESPSLQRRLADRIARVYPRTRLKAAQETQLELDTFPETCPFSQEEILG